jgi:tetratricopeptide (TPR) repeat protein
LKFRAILLTLLAGLSAPALQAWEQAADEAADAPPVESAPPAAFPEPEVDAATASHSPFTVFGRVTTPAGDPVSGVRVTVALGANFQAPIVVETNLRGEFRSEHSETINRDAPVLVTAVATKPGFSDGRETATVLPERRKAVEVVMRPEASDLEVTHLRLETLLAGMSPRLREAGKGVLTGESARRNFEEGCSVLAESGKGLPAAPFLTRAVEAEPACLECRLALSLAFLASGSWVSAERELTQAAASPGAARRSEIFVILGFLEAWRGDLKLSEERFRQAHKLDPSDPLAPQELGRILVAAGKWAEAAEMLGKALEAGASQEAHLLRTRALLKLGDRVNAEQHFNAYLAGKQPRDLSLPARLIYLDLQDRMVLDSYQPARSVLELSPADMVEMMPELKGLQPAADQRLLPGLLRRVGRVVQALFHAFPNTMSQEDIRHQYQGSRGEMEDLNSAKFEYLMLTREERWGMGLTEHRANQDQPNLPNKPRGPVSTAGFASTPLFFHPAYQDGSDYRYLGRQRVDGRPTRVLAFAQRLGSGTILSRFVSARRSLPLLIQGVVWVDATDHRILRMRTELLRIPEEHGLSQQTTLIRFGEAYFKELGSRMWLPQDVSVTIGWKGRTFRNIHHYSDFRLFRVEAEDKLKGPVHAIRGGKPRPPVALGLKSEE